MMRPSAKAALWFAASIPLALLIVSVMGDMWFMALYYPAAIAALVVVDIMAVLPSRRLDLKLDLPKRLFVGQRGLVKAAIDGNGYKTKTKFEAVLEHTGEADDPATVNGLMTEGRLELDLGITPRRRGRMGLEALWLRWRGPLGFIEIILRHPVEESIDVVPDVHGIHEAALQFFAHDAVFGIKTQRFRGEGTEFDALCEYSQGMDTRFIDWKRSAHHRKLLCKEFKQERNHQVVLGFDTGHLMLEPINGIPKLDHAIKAGLLLSWISLHSGDLVGGCGFDVNFRGYIKPGRGMPYFTQFQRFTAGLDYRAEETNFTLGLAELNSRLKRRALVVLFTEFVDTISAELLIESLTLMARRHLVVFVTMRDPMLTGVQAALPDNFQAVAKAVTAGSFLRERSIVLERVARLGVHTLDVSAETMSASLLNRYLMIKQRGML